jgi:FkbM family methyltransferase
MSSLVRKSVKTLLDRLGYICRAKSSAPFGIELALDLERLNIHPTTIFDVGAHTGQVSLAFRQAYPSASIYAFEPSSGTFATLTRNCAGKNIIGINSAVGSAPGSAQLHAKSESYLNSLVGTLNVERTGAVLETVKVIALDDFCAERRIDHIDILKTDTEGYELEVLKGCRRLLGERRISAVYAECAARPTSRHVGLRELADVLDGHGFSMRGLYEQSWYDWDERGHLFGNALFVLDKAKDD